MLLEDAQIDLSHSRDAFARRRALCGVADQGVSVSIGDPIESTAGVFEIDDHPTDAKTESRSRFTRRACRAFSQLVLGNGMISKNIRFGANYQHKYLTEYVLF